MACKVFLYSKYFMGVGPKIWTYQCKKYLFNPQTNLWSYSTTKIKLILLIFLGIYHYQKINKYKQKYRQNIFIGKLQWILQTEYSFAIFISKYRWKYSLNIHRENYSKKNQNKTKKYNNILFIPIILILWINLLVLISIELPIILI